MFGFLKNVSRGPAANMANIAVPPTPQNVMTGPVEYKVYVYDNRPLLRIPPGHSQAADNTHERPHRY